MDRELSKIQMLVLDSFAPLTAIVDNNAEMLMEEIKEASVEAVELIGNAKAKINQY